MGRTNSGFYYFQLKGRTMKDKKNPVAYVEITYKVVLPIEEGLANLNALVGAGSRKKMKDKKKNTRVARHYRRRYGKKFLIRGYTRQNRPYRRDYNVVED